MTKTGESRRYRSIFISDTHLGSKGAQADALLHFLKHTESDYLYLVGDIVDGWALKGRWYWPQKHNDVIQKLMRKARRGTKVVYLPGNHDEFARNFLNTSFGDVDILDDTIHVTADNKRMWVVHGDLFDGVMQHARWLAYLGDRAYSFLLVINRIFNRVRQFFNLPYWSLSQYLKHKVKKAVSFISAFETALSTEAKRRECDGVVCGHIHKPELHEMNDILYANCGDWVESISALVEHQTGELELLFWANEYTILDRDDLDLEDQLPEVRTV